MKNFCEIASRYQVNFDNPRWDIPLQSKRHIEITHHEAPTKDTSEYFKICLYCSEEEMKERLFGDKGLVVGILTPISGYENSSRLPNEIGYITESLIRNSNDELDFLKDSPEYEIDL